MAAYGKAMQSALTVAHGIDISEGLAHFEHEHWPFGAIRGADDEGHFQPGLFQQLLGVRHDLYGLCLSGLYFGFCHAIDDRRRAGQMPMAGNIISS